MKKKRKKKPASRLNSLPGLGSAPDVPKRENSQAASFAAELFGSEKLEDVRVEKFKMQVAENITAEWNTVICDDQMFIHIPSVLSPVGGKESFISLLEIAEEELGCENVICCIQKSATERSAQIRTFMYMGFQQIAPSSPLLPHAGRESGKFIFLGYEL